MGIIQVQHIKAACEQRFYSFVDTTDLALTISPEDKADKILSRSLAAFAVAELSRCDDRIAANAVVDEFQDDGIDAFHYDREEHVCYLVQSKWRKNGSGGVDLGAVLKFIQGINHLLEAKVESLGPKLQAKNSDISDALGDSVARFVLCIACTGQQELSPETQKPLTQLLTELNEDDELVTLRVLLQKDLHDIVAHHAVGESVDLTVMLHEYGAVKTPYRAFYGQLEVGDISEWASYGDNLYHRNIRGFKGSTDVNTAIVDTLHNRPDNFWYFNNGITILCSQLTKQPIGGKSKDSGVFECKGASIVNGAQTVGSVIAALNDGGPVENARVVVRLISLEKCPDEFGSELTRATNTQNRIEKRDFAALDPNQPRLRTELLLSFNKEYAYKTGEAQPSSDAGCTLDEASVALACANDDVGYCVQAKREIGRLYDNIKQPPYTNLFNSSLTALRLWKSVQILRIVESKLKQSRSSLQGRAKLISAHGNRFVLHLIFRSIGPDVLNNQSDIDEELTKLITDETETVVADVIDAVGELFHSGYAGSLFKNQTKCKALLAKMTK